MKINRFAVVLICVCALSLIGTTAFAWSGTGTETDPYLISSADDLRRFADIVHGANGQTQNSSACGTLAASINLNGSASDPWTPIGTAEHPYSGTFKGYYSMSSRPISDLYTTGGAAGLFGYTQNATIMSVTIASGSVTGSGAAGAIAANAQNTAIQNCEVKNSVSVTISASGSISASGVGGIVGVATGSTLTNCTNNAAVTANGAYGGGICGILNGGRIGAEPNNRTTGVCTNYGTVTAADAGARVGGVCGQVTGGGVVSRCVNDGTAGGYPSANNAAGICYDVNNGQLFDCHNKKAVTASGYGIAGDSTGGLVVNCLNSAGSGGGVGSGSALNCYYPGCEGYPADDTGGWNAALTSGEIAWKLNYIGGIKGNSVVTAHYASPTNDHTGVWWLYNYTPTNGNIGGNKPSYRLTFPTTPPLYGQ